MEKSKINGEREGGREGGRREKGEERGFNSANKRVWPKSHSVMYSPASPLLTNIDQFNILLCAEVENNA